MPSTKGPCLHLGLLDPAAAQVNKHNKNLILCKYKTGQPSLGWKVPAPGNLFQYKLFLLSPPLLWRCQTGDLAAEHISRHLNRFLNSLTSDLVFLSTAEMSSNSLINAPVAGKLNCSVAWESGSSMTKGLGECEMGADSSPLLPLPAPLHNVSDI